LGKISLKAFFKSPFLIANCCNLAATLFFLELERLIFDERAFALLKTADQNH